MKKAILFFSMLFISTSLTFGQTATLSLPDLGEQPAGSVFFPITIDTIDDGIGTFQIFLEFDKTVLTPVDVTYPDPNFPRDEWMNNLVYGEGELILTWLNSEGTNTNPVPGEVICIIEFIYSDESAFSPLIWETNKPGPGKSEKVMTALWTKLGKQFTLKLIDGSIGVSQ
ncbi:MAG: hypothetical protein H8D45_17340 [Bacteroidetes bacterium]|nr:hypothetical protein [Bacteroidota bacterium]MBL7103260.1 hypothetical protein [Bacteroidales bacterium]